LKSRRGEVNTNRHDNSSSHHWINHGKKSPLKLVSNNSCVCISFFTWRHNNFDPFNTSK
jgi:hypothetical protein